MRITFFLSSLWLSGGVWHVLQFADHLEKRGHYVSLVVPGKTIDDSIRAFLSRTSITVLESPIVLSPSTKTKKLMLAKLVWSMATIAPSSDVLIATHTPTVVPTLLASWIFRKGRATWFYMDYKEQFEGRPFEQWLLNHAPRWFRVILTISKPEAILVRTKTKATVISVGSGLRSSLFHELLPREYNLQPPFRLLYVGDARPRKGFRDALTAIEEVARSLPVEFHIVSKTPLSFTTWVPHKVYIKPQDEELIHLYRTSDIFVFSSWREGLGYPPLEAMACGTPVVLTNSWGVLDYVHDGENCLLVPPRQPTKLAQAILRLLKDKSLYMRLAQNGLKTAQQYTWEKVIDRSEYALKLLFNS